MPNQFSPSQGSQSPRSVLPPLSKYYYGPAQGTASPQRVNHEDGKLGWEKKNPAATPPALPPRHPGSAEAFSASQWMSHFASSEQLWQLPGPPAFAPPASHVASSTYNPSTYGPMPGAQTNTSPSNNAAFSGRWPSNAAWEEQSNQVHFDEAAPATKPPLPPRPHGSLHQERPPQGLDQRSSQASQAAFLEFLPSLAYNASGGVALPNPQAPSHNSSNEFTTSAPPQRLPPPPPPKLPPEHDEELTTPLQTSNFFSSDGSHPSDTLDEGQRQYERFQASQRDSVTYSIPSSIWRQEAPQAHKKASQPLPDYWTRNEAKNFHSAEGPQERRPTSPTSLKEREYRTMASAHIEPGEGHSASTNWEHEIAPRLSQLHAKGERIVESKDNSISIHPEHRKAHFKGESVGEEDSENEQQRSDSFYWQSPHSSIHSTKDEQVDQHVTEAPAKNINGGESRLPTEAENTHQGQKNPVSSTLLSHSTLGSYSASALGFGGPSDWEHFGDYEAEDIDDTALYIRPKSPVKASELLDTAELSAETPKDTKATTEDVQQNAEQIIRLETSSVSEELAEASMSEKSGKAFSDPSHLRRASYNGLSLGRQGQVVSQNEGPSRYLGATPPDIDTKNPATDAPNDEAYDTKLNETIKIWSRAGSMENLILAQSTRQTSVTEDKPTSDHTLEPLVNGDVQLETVKLPLAKGTSPIGDAQVGSWLGGQIENAKSEAASLSNVHDPFVEKAGRQQSNPSDLAYGQGKPEPVQTSADSAITHGIGLDLTSIEATVKQPTLALTQGPFSKTLETDDPYAGLDAWGKASLNRYIAMLREEFQADSDKEKFKIFTVFTTRETRLRAVLYDVDSEQINTPAITAMPKAIKSPIKRSSTTSYKRASKALPALPDGVSNEELVEVNGHSRKPSKKLSAAAILGNPKPAPKALDTTNLPPTDDVYVMVDSPQSAQYSPGGRPLVPRIPRTNTPSNIAKDSQKIGVVATNDTPNAGEHADLPIPTSPDPQTDESGAAYVPFKYSGDRSEAQAYAANRLSKRQSVLRPYSKMMGSDEHRETFSNEIAAKEDIPKIPSKDFLQNSSSPADGKVELDLRRFIRADFDPLLSVLPEAGDIRPESLQLSDLKDIMYSVPDDFTFIHQSVVAWDKKAKWKRDSNERERHARQVESEQRIDALFDDHEIGYGDISELESGFKRSEAARKADEDRAEYQTFVSEVFDVVWTRLHYEIDQLTPHYQNYTEVLNTTTAGKDMFNPSSDRFALAPTMDALLTLHQKLEIRHQKAFEAVLERDRRLKKVELSPWYSLGNVAKVKQLERQFEVAEKRAILDYCKQRDIRANNLMDNLDQNTLRGVGANQDYMEMVMKAVRRIASGRAFASQPGSGEPGVGLDEVTKAKSITKALATSSEQIVQTFHVTDMLLNAADYELSVAKATLEGADRAAFQNLKEEKAKEDQKLMRDLEHRLALIREDSRRTHDEIVKLLLFLGVQSGHAETSSSAPKATDREHEERLQKALEEAKRRNAATGSPATPLT